MASLLDIGLMGHFAPVFTFLLIFTVTYAILMKVDFFNGENNKGLYAIIALVLAAVTLFIPSVVSLVNIITPWFVLLMIFVFLIILVFMAFGVKGDSITNALKENMSVPWAIVAIGIIIAIFAFSQVYGAQLSYKEGVNETTSNTFNEGVKEILFHPKMLGAIFLLVIGALAVRLLTTP